MYRETQQFPQLAALWLINWEKLLTEPDSSVGGHLPWQVGVSVENGEKTRNNCVTITLELCQTGCYNENNNLQSYLVSLGVSPFNNF